VNLGFWPCALILLLAFIAGVVVAGRLAWLRRLFVPSREMERGAVARAKSLFFDQRLHRTSGATGVLVYISLFERAAVVLADDAVAKSLSDRALDEVRDQVLDGVKEAGVAKGLAAGIERLGDLLGAALPAAADDVDELPNEVVLLE
jgi:putative membrane protein